MYEISDTVIFARRVYLIRWLLPPVKSWTMYDRPELVFFFLADLLRNEICFFGLVGFQKIFLGNISQIPNTGYVQIFFALSLRWIVASLLFLFVIGYGVCLAHGQNNKAGSKCLCILYWRNERFSFDVQYSTQKYFHRSSFRIFIARPSCSFFWLKDDWVQSFIKVLRSRPSKICGRQPLKHLKAYGNFLKAVLHIFYSVHSWILCTIYYWGLFTSFEEMCDLFWVNVRFTLIFEKKDWRALNSMGTLQRNVAFEPFQSLGKNFVPNFILILRLKTMGLKTFFESVLR